MIGINNTTTSTDYIQIISSSKVVSISFYSSMIPFEMKAVNNSHYITLKLCDISH